MTVFATISFEGSITLPLEELDAALGDAAQAVQNAIGHTGALVVSAETDHTDDDDGANDDLSLDELAEREQAEADRYWPDDEAA